MKLFRRFLLLVVASLALLSSSVNSARAQAYNPINPDQLGAEIDEFFAAGAEGYLVWQYSGDRGTGQEFANDGYSFFRNIAPGPRICETLQIRSRGSKFVGVNMWDAGAHDEAKITSHFEYLKNACGVSVIRSFANAGEVEGVRKLLNAANAVDPNGGLKIIIVLGDASNGDARIPAGPADSWYESGYESGGYMAFVQEVARAAANHPNLYGFELANEPHCGGSTTCPPFYNSWAAAVSNGIRILSSKPIGIGQMANENNGLGHSPGVQTTSNGVIQGGSPSDFQSSNSTPNITMTSGHYYGPTEKQILLTSTLPQSQTLGKPFYIGEAGWGGSTVDFDLLEVPCSQTYPDVTGDPNSPDFHSLRPYPASPCDPTPILSPAMCGDDLVARVQYEFTIEDAVGTADGRQPACDEPQDDGSQLCHFRVAQSMDLTLGLVGAELPIVGNTEDVPNSTSDSETIDFKTRVNEYVSWYLNGITNRAEEEDETIKRAPPYFWFNATPENEIIQRIYEVINLSGPLKKLLPFAIQNGGFEMRAQGATVIAVPLPNQPGLRGTQKEEAGSTRHNQIAVCEVRKVQDLPFPVRCYRGEDAVRYRLTGIRPFFFLPGVLASGKDTYNPLFSFIPFSSTEDVVGIAKTDSRDYAIGGSEEGARGVIDISFNPKVPVGRPLYFAHMLESDELGDALQGTFVPQGMIRNPEAPTPGKDAQEASPFCEPLEDPISNPGDSLYGALERNSIDGDVEPVQGTLSFTAEFSCRFPPSVPDTACLELCYAENPTSPDPSLTLDEYCASICPGSEAPNCTREIFVPMAVTVSTPLADSLWSRFVMGSMSIFRRMMPRVEEGSPIDEILDIPGETNVSYSGTLVDYEGPEVDEPTSTSQSTTSQAIAGNPFAGRSSAGSLYFPHLGSLHEYFLHGIQCALRPFGMCGEGGITEPPPAGAICSIQNSGIASQELLNIIAGAARWARIPVELLTTVVRGEGCGGGDRTGGICVYTDQQVLQYSAPGAIDPRNCPSTPGDAKGPMQIYEDSVNWEPWKNAVNMATGENRTPEICNIKDAIYAGAYILSAGYDGCPNPGHNVSSVPSPSNWSIEQVQNSLTAWAAGCSVERCSGIAAGFYCTQYSIWSSQIDTDCNQ